MSKLSVDLVISTANSHAQNGELEEAKKLYKAVLLAFPGNKNAQQGLASVSKNKELASTQEPLHNITSQLISLYNQGQMKVVVDQALLLTEQYPDNIIIWNILGAANKGLNRVSEAVQAFKKVTVLNPSFADGFNNLGFALKDQGKLDDAIGAYKKALSLKPDYAEAYNNLGNAFKDQGKLEAALTAYKKALSLKPDYADAYSNMGATLHEKGQLDDAIGAYKKALSLRPDCAKTYNNMGNVLKDQGSLDDAIAAYENALSLKPDHAGAYNNLGVALKDQGKLEAALTAYKNALALEPDNVDAYSNMGVTLHEKGSLEDALASYNKALSLRPDHAESYNNMGNVLKDQGKREEAIAAYKNALLLKPDNAGAYNNMGIALHAQGKLKDALASYNKALSLRPDHAESYNNMGNVLKDQGKLKEAIAAYKNALSMKPDYAAARAQCLHQMAHICDWSWVEDDQYDLEKLGIKGGSIPPFSVLSFEDAPDRHRLRSINYVQKKHPQKAIVLPVKPPKKPEKLRIGYFSADFYDHATMYLMAQVFAAHDKSLFQVSVYSYGPDKNDEMRKGLISDVNVFHDVRDMNDMQLVDLARADKLDIAIDLKGFTSNTRLAPFAYGLAPVQISYLGYPGTLGADFIDYIVADPILIPEDKREYYSEQIIYLPNTYQPTDNTRIISEKSITRQEMGLPRKGFVFCCFNNNYKISSNEFDIWMRLLSKVEGSVLWLLKSNRWAQQNLKREAEARGINAERLVFAERVPQAEHLARQKLADLFLDTFNVNAHTTTSDALWVGLPVVTKLGKGFAARVAGSLLTASGLPELITESEEEYEALILDLATKKWKLSKIRKKLAANRLSTPLFDSEKYTRNLEEGYQMAYNRYLNGQEPEHIFVPK